MLSDVALLSDTPATAWQRAVCHEGGPLVVLGPAGSGKTSLLLARFHWLVSQGAMPDRIALLAPTPSRADDARARLEQELVDGYSQLIVTTPTSLASMILRRAGASPETGDHTLAAGDRLAMLAERIDELPLAHHDFAGNARGLLGGFIRRIDRLKAELIGADDYARWAAGLADSASGEREREFAGIYGAHERMLTDAGARDDGDVVRLALGLAQSHAQVLQPLEHVLVDDAQELDLASASLVKALGCHSLTVAGDPLAGARRFRGAGAERLRSFETAGAEVVRLVGSHRCPDSVMRIAWAIALGRERPADDEVQAAAAIPPASELQFWRCAGERAQAQAVAADIERLISREGVAPGRIAVLVPALSREGRSVSIALEERALPHRLIGEAALFQQAEVRDLLAWLRLLADPGDAPAVVRALARPPIELRAVDIARCTQISRRRKLDMVAALAAATESPQVPPEARERLRVFLKLYRAGVTSIDTMRPDLYVHRLVGRLGLRRTQLFGAQADVVERLRALARFGELASAYATRAPLASAREFARSVAAVAEYGLREQEEPELDGGGDLIHVLEAQDAAGFEVEHAYVLGLHAGLAAPAAEPVPDELLHEPLPADDGPRQLAALRALLYVALTRAHKRVVLSYAATGEQGAASAPCAPVEGARQLTGGRWETVEEELFGPAEGLHSTYRLLRDELLEGTARAGSRLAELRFDTDLDVSHAVVRYLELLKLAALIARPEGQGVAEALHDVNARILQAVTAEQREIFTSSALDDYLLGADRDERRRAQVIAARDEPSLEAFLPRRGDGVILSASDIDAYRACPLRYKFVVHQVLERFHAGREGEPLGSLASLLGLLDAGWRRGGFGDSEEERQLRGKAAEALARYHERALEEDCQPIWFERQFTFKLGPHLLRGRVDRVDRLPGGEYELIDYKTGRAKTPAQLRDDVQLSLYAVGAREAWSLESSRQSYYYVLDDEKVTVPAEEGDRGEWIRAVAVQVAEGILAQEFEPTPSRDACLICDYRLICPAVER
jgi:DNA helicase II / ATP-dependent DNA helicase PcrA